MKKWNNNLFKTLLFLVVSIFTFSLLVACNDEKTTSNPTSSPTTSQTSNPTSNPTTTTTTTTTVAVNMTESYRTNRANFKTVTGIELPALEKLVVDDYPYTAGDTSYCFDIISGDNLNYSTYQTFENFFKDKFGNCDSGYPTGDEATGRDAQWTNEGRWYQTYWDKTNNAIYINTDARSAENDQMTNTYKEGRNQFHDIVGIWLPKLDNIELLDSSAFSTTYQTACFDFLGNKNLFDSVLAQLKTIITEQPAREDSNGAYWEYIIQVNGKNRKINIEISYDPDNTAGTAIYINGIARDYYSVTLTAGTGGSATLKMGSHIYDNNVANVTAGDNLILTATPSANYSFAGWLIGTESLGTTNPYTYVAEKKDVTIQAVFLEETSNMEDDYKAVRTAFNQLSGISLPEFEGVNTDNKYVNVDNDNHVRDEAQADLLFASTTLMTQGYNDIKTLFVTAYGNPAESSSGEYMIMDQWSIPYYDATIPYRIEAMMNTQPDGTSISLMWRKQPIVIINVSSDGPGTATGVYINSEYQEVPYTKYFEIVDAFHGTLVATPNTGMVFDGWYVNNERVSTSARYTFNYAKADVTFTEITFVGKFSEPASVTMTESYSQARTSFETATGLVLPELETVTAMFENLGSSQYMVDISGATSDTLSAVMSAFNTQTNTTSTLDSYNKNVYTYIRNVNNATYECELSCFLDSGLVVIMYQETLSQMTETYSLTRSIFKNATGVELPLITNLDADIAFGSGYFMWDIVGGTNLTKATYDNIIAYLDGLTGWSGVDDTQDAAYPTKKYTNSTSGIAFQVVWNGDSSTGGIYLNVMGTGLLSTFDGFSEAKTILATRHDITIPTMTNLSVDFSCDADSTYMTFDMTKASNFTESEYNQFVNALTTKLGNGTDASEENVNKKTTWTVNGLFWSVEWDLTDCIAINFSVAQNNA